MLIVPIKKDKIYDWFKDDDEVPKIISNVGVLTTGFDAPKTSYCIIEREVGSLGLFSQMVGRALRGPAAGGTSKAQIVIMESNSGKEFTDLVRTFDNWNHLWLESG